MASVPSDSGAVQVLARGQPHPKACPGNALLPNSHAVWGRILFFMSRWIEGRVPYWLLVADLACQVGLSLPQRQRAVQQLSPSSQGQGSQQKEEKGDTRWKPWELWVQPTEKGGNTK